MAQRSSTERYALRNNGLSDGIACLCLSIGASTPTDALDRVFGSASHANAPTLAGLSPRMDQLFLAALKELAAPNPFARRG